MSLGLIGGTGLYELEAEREKLTVDTACGPVTVYAAQLGGQEVFFLPRHGRAHQIAPHLINYRANTLALQQLGCDRLLAFNAVGGIARHLPPGELCLATQFLDFTRRRPLTLHEGPEHPVRHADFTEPYCPDLRAALRRAAESLGLALHPGVTYVCAEGPRFETPAEIRMFAQLGGDVVGMTGVPEVVFAREAGMCYASLCVVTNFAAGVKQSPLTHGEVAELMRHKREELLRLAAAALPLVPAQPACACRGCA